MVNTQTHLAGTGAHQCVGKHEVGDDVAGSMVGGLLDAGGGAETESGQNGTATLVYSQRHGDNCTYDMVERCCADSCKWLKTPEIPG